MYVQLLSARKQERQQTAMMKATNKKSAWVHSTPKRGASRTDSSHSSSEGKTTSPLPFTIDCHLVVFFICPFRRRSSPAGSASLYSFSLSALSCTVYCFANALFSSVLWCLGPRFPLSLLLFPSIVCGRLSSAPLPHSLALAQVTHLYEMLNMLSFLMKQPLYSAYMLGSRSCNSSCCCNHFCSSSH